MIILRLLAGLTGLAVSEGMKRSEIRRKADIINARYYENKRKEEERRKRLAENGPEVYRNYLKEKNQRL